MKTLAMRTEIVETSSFRPSRRLVGVFALTAVVLMATSIGTTHAQVLTGSWNKVRQGCVPGQTTCGVKAKFTVQNPGAGVAPATNLQVYLSNDMVFGGDTLLHTSAVGPVNPGESVPVKMDFNLALGVSASGSFLIARLQGNTTAVFANPGPTGVVLFDKLFGPNSVTVTAGTRVRWMHRDDGEDHTVTSGTCDPGGNGCNDTGIFTSGHDPNFMQFLEDFLRVFDNIGVFPYFCEEHEEDMTGTIVVIAP